MIAKIPFVVAFVCYLIAAFDAYIGNTAGVIFMLFNVAMNVFFGGVFNLRRRDD